MWERVGNDPIPPDKIICAPPCRGLITHTDTHTHMSKHAKKCIHTKTGIYFVTLCSIISFHTKAMAFRDRSGYQNGRIFRKNSKWHFTPPSFWENYVPIFFLGKRST